jgi:hypothetical protein
VKDRTVGLSVVVAGGLWAVAGVLFVGVMVTGDVRVLGAATLMTGLATTAAVRTYFVAFSTMVRKAFEMEEEPVTRLRNR